MNLNLKIHFLPPGNCLSAVYFCYRSSSFPLCLAESGFCQYQYDCDQGYPAQISTIMLILFPLCWLHSHFAGYDFSRHIIPFLVLLYCSHLSAAFMAVEFSHQRRAGFYRWFTYILSPFACSISVFRECLICLSLELCCWVRYQFVRPFRRWVSIFTDLFQFEQQVFVRRVVGSLGNPDFLAGYLAGFCH